MDVWLVMALTALFRQGLNVEVLPLRKERVRADELARAEGARESAHSWPSMLPHVSPPFELCQSQRNVFQKQVENPAFWSSPEVAGETRAAENLTMKESLCLALQASGTGLGGLEFYGSGLWGWAVATVYNCAHFTRPVPRETSATEIFQLESRLSQHSKTSKQCKSKCELSC